MRSMNWPEIRRSHTAVINGRNEFGSNALMQGQSISVVFLGIWCVNEKKITKNRAGTATTTKLK